MCVGLIQHPPPSPAPPHPAPRVCPPGVPAQGGCHVCGNQASGERVAGPQGQCPPALISGPCAWGSSSAGLAAGDKPKPLARHLTTWGVHPGVRERHAPAAAPPGRRSGARGAQPPGWPAADPGQPAAPGSGACWCRLSPWSSTLVKAAGRGLACALCHAGRAQWSAPPAARGAAVTSAASAWAM